MRPLHAVVSLPVAVLVGLAGSPAWAQSGEARAPRPLVIAGQLAVAPEAVYDAPMVENGRLWIARPIIGGVRTDLHERGERDAGAWAAASYGAYGRQLERPLVEIDGLFEFESGRLVSIDPWREITLPRKDRENPTTNAYKNARSELVRQAREARREWLQEENYTGGVRTFVNDLVLWKPSPRAEAPTPRAVIEIPPEMPRLRGRMRVEGPSERPEARPAARPAARAVTRVLPADAPVSTGDRAAVRVVRPEATPAPAMPTTSAAASAPRDGQG